jgi:hypothetical protein
MIENYEIQDALMTGIFFLSSFVALSLSIALISKTTGAAKRFKN